MKYKLCIFDMDGTVLDTIQDLTDALNYGLRKYGMNERNVSEVRQFVGNGMKKTIERSLGKDFSEKKAEEIYKAFTEYYSVHCADNTRPYSGIADLLRDIKHIGCHTAIVSNKDDYAVKKLSDRFFGLLVDITQGQTKDIRKKPFPDSVNAVMEHFGVSCGETVYIGDSEVDLQTAANAGIDCISVDWGFKGHKFLMDNNASYIVSEPREIFERISAEI